MSTASIHHSFIHSSIKVHGFSHCHRWMDGFFLLAWFFFPSFLPSFYFYQQTDGEKDEVQVGRSVGLVGLIEAFWGGVQPFTLPPPLPLPFSPCGVLSNLSIGVLQTPHRHDVLRGEWMDRRMGCSGFLSFLLPPPVSFFCFVFWCVYSSGRVLGVSERWRAG